MKNKIPKIWYDELVNLCYVQSHSNNEKLMVLYLDKWLNNHSLSYTIDNVGNIIVTKGNATTYPCIISHMDTVHTFVKDYEIFIDKKREKLCAQSGKNNTGIGGDDKCGIFACLYFLKTLPAVKVVFFTQEESGLRGSNRIDKSFFDDCRYIIQLDRRDSKDFIDTKFQQKTISHSFSSEIGHVKKTFKFKSTEGSITDCVNLWSDGVGISCVNISSGYYNPHMATEYIAIDELWHSVMFVKEVIKTLKPKRYISIKKQIVWKSNSYPTNLSGRHKTLCSICNIFKLLSLGSYINNKFVCLTCSNDNSQDFVCKSCFKPSNIKDLQWSTDLACMACSACRATTKNTVCDVCNRPINISQGHIINRDEFVCYSCYLEKQTNELLDELETCSSCKEKSDKTKGEYDGEIFTCKDCLKINSGIYTEVCDTCKEQTPITMGIYGVGGGEFNCYKCLANKIK